MPKGTGLKHMIEKALQPEPVEVSGEALHALATKVREWSGWSDAGFKIGNPRGSNYASCDHNERLFTANIDRLSINPNRVLLTVTPFRLKQEAVLTGALLHEAGHARFSHWGNHTEHGDGTPITHKVVKFARIFEEPRVEALMAQNAPAFGALGLDWTMRASAAHLLPLTEMRTDPNQKIMDLITSWVLRAGRERALELRTGHTTRYWVQSFTRLVTSTIANHLNDLPDVKDEHGDVIGGSRRARQAVQLMEEMIVCDDHHGTTMVDKARDLLDLLFPETDPEDMPDPEDSCEDADESESESGEGGEGDEEGSEGKGNTEPDDPGEGEDPGVGDKGQPEDEGDDEAGADSEDEPEGEGDEAAGDGDPEDDESDDEAEGGSGDIDTEGLNDSEGGVPTPSDADDDPLAKALRDIEQLAQEETEEETEEAAEEAETDPAKGAGSGDGEGGKDEWRAPTKEEREVQRTAEKFLRELIAPAESSKSILTDVPSSQVDGEALTAWKAGGMQTDPRFFRRTQRFVAPSPPVKIAVLVDVSMSMGVLQAPSALLSWALSMASLDLRNFAGRGQQVESCLIHWGDKAQVIQKNGETMRGIREYRCWQGTTAMHEALDLVAEEIPGFFDNDGPVENRLLVQFTDWELASWSVGPAKHRIEEALAAGVNMLTVAPPSYRDTHGAYGQSSLPKILHACKNRVGIAPVLRFNPANPDQVWAEAAKALA